MEAYSKWESADVDSLHNPLDKMYYNRSKNKTGLPEAYQAGVSHSTAAIGDRMLHQEGLTKNSLSQVSSERAEYVQSVLDRRDSSNGRFKATGPVIVREDTRLKRASKGPNLIKNAISGTQGLSHSGNTVHIAPELYSPFYLTQNMQLPRDILTANSWNRAYYETNPMVRNAINLHATYPISKMSIKCEDKKVEQFFQDMIERVGLETVVQHAALEFWKLGEAVSARSYTTLSDGSVKMICDVEIGDTVLTHTGSKKKVIDRFVKPTKDIKANGGKIYKVTINGLADPLIISGNHPILSSNRKNFICETPSCRAKGMRILPGKTKCSNCGKVGFQNNYTPDFELTENMSKGDMVYAPFNRDEEIDDDRFTDEFSYLMGQWLAEGCSLASFFYEHCGEYSKEKTLSETVMNLPPAKQLQLLAGFVDGDGCVDQQNGHVIISTSSQSLANQFMMMLRRAGARPSISKVKSKVGSVPTGNYENRIRLVANEAYELFKGKLKSDKGDKLSKSKWCSPITAIQDSWQVTNITKIEEITDTFKDEYMYDLEVEDDHSYVANGIAVHNCFVYSDFDESIGSWDKIYLHNPDFISVKASPIPGVVTISLRPDPELTRIITSNEPSHVRIRESLDPRIVSHVLNNEHIPLDSFNISHLKNLSSPYDVRGTSLIVSVWKDLMLYDKLRESKFVQADGMINPLTLVKVGSSNPDGHYPTGDELDAYRNILEQAQYDKDFKLVTHDAVSIERIGYNGTVMDTAADFQMIIDNILMGLMVPKAVITQEGATYASASVALDVMRQRYNNFRTLMSNWLEQKIFAPISEVQGFYKPEGGIKRLIVPQVEWNHMTLYDLDNYLNHILGLIDKKKVSTETVYRSLGLNKENEMANVRSEQIQDAILKKEEEQLGKLTLTELRALDPKKPVPEKPGDALPGTPGGPGGGGGLGDLGGMDGLLGGGAMPPPDFGGDMGMSDGPSLGPGGPGGDLSEGPPGGLI